MNKTLKYYDENAQSFFENTASVDFLEHYKRFLKYIPKGGRILDYGCGSGRDAKFFSENGYEVTALDGSRGLCRLAREWTGLKVERKDFLELNVLSYFDGVWACASLLHLCKEDLKLALEKVYRSLVEEGYVYLSFKYGNFSGFRNGRYFQDFTEEDFCAFIRECDGFEILETWVSVDARKDRDGQWLNIILRKIKPIQLLPAD